MRVVIDIPDDVFRFLVEHDRSIFPEMVEGLSDAVVAVGLIGDVLSESAGKWRIAGEPSPDRFCAIRVVE